MKVTSFLLNPHHRLVNSMLMTAVSFRYMDPMITMCYISIFISMCYFSIFMSMCYIPMCYVSIFMLINLFFT
ncbi:hypothetical protein C2G38_2062469 [Gigaspora rosea]|uniref:Uncharacterized protein n=1 Tax=Gigaspora rosea TaxID=44941 RepID=A0A397W4S2_9GLOM|nr:hypothetical protein C2G38_2062469 [Gigaspora rosea]